MQFGVFEVSPIFEVLKGSNEQMYELNEDVLAKVTYILEWLPNSEHLSWQAQFLNIRINKQDYRQNPFKFHLSLKMRILFYVTITIV